HDGDVDLQIGGTAIYSVLGTVSGDAVGVLTNVATVSPPPSIEDSDLGNNESSAALPVVTPIFADGFESGDTSRWSSSVGSGPRGSPR
ncbi:MAG: hypothetical protein AAF368_14695, partial [Planctomycetota bacterium]